MRWSIVAASCFAAGLAHAQPAEVICFFNDGKRMTSVLSEGRVIFRFEGGEWRSGRAEVENNVITVVHSTANGYMRVAFDLRSLPNMGAYGVVRTLPDHRIIWESAAICR